MLEKIFDPVCAIKCYSFLNERNLLLSYSNSFNNSKQNISVAF